MNSSILSFNNFQNFQRGKQEVSYAAKGAS